MEAHACKPSTEGLSQEGHGFKAFHLRETIMSQERGRTEKERWKEIQEELPGGRRGLRTQSSVSHRHRVKTEERGCDGHERGVGKSAPK